MVEPDEGRVDLNAPNVIPRSRIAPIVHGASHIDVALHHDRTPLPLRDVGTEVGQLQQAVVGGNGEGGLVRNVDEEGHRPGHLAVRRVDRLPLAVELDVVVSDVAFLVGLEEVGVAVARVSVRVAGRVEGRRDDVGAVGNGLCEGGDVGFRYELRLDEAEQLGGTGFRDGEERVLDRDALG